MEYSKIEWTDHTFNPWIGCTQISPACQYCYAMVMMAMRYKKVEWGRGKPRLRTTEDYWRKPISWDRKAKKAGVRWRVFCCSLADVFDGESREILDEWRKDLWALIEKTPNLDWLLLTKRPENVMEMVPWGRAFPGNVWIGTTVEDSKYAEIRLPILSEIPAAVRFVSAEPLLSDFSLKGYKVDWLIAGGESGTHFREVNPDHIRSLRDQCKSRGISFFFKQWGGRSPKENGRELDGREWSEFPTPRRAVSVT